MIETLETALELRKANQLKKSNEILLRLVKQNADDAFLNYQCAWSFDVLGEETKAVPFYEKAIQLGLISKDLEGAFLGLGSTYRALGNYEKAKETFLRAISIFPDNHAMKTFYAMTLYNLNEHDKAMEILLTSLINTTSDPTILQYEKALRFYSYQLDKTWS